MIVGLSIYILLGYLSQAYLSKDLEFAEGILRMIVFSLLFGWATIPLAILKLVLVGSWNLIRWLFNW